MKPKMAKTIKEYNQDFQEKRDNNQTKFARPLSLDRQRTLRDISYNPNRLRCVSLSNTNNKVATGEDGGGDGSDGTAVMAVSSNQISISKFRSTPRSLPPPPPPSMNYMLPLASSPARRSKKRALLCGVSYRGAKIELRGSINDVTSMRELLIKNFGYTKEWIRVLTEYETNLEFLPTKANIISSMRWLVENNQPGDTLVFFFSGHGLRQPDFDNDEIDGFDETICPLDYKENGMIVDNEINSIIVSPLKEGVKLHAIVDACHSGTILNLPYVFDNKMKTWKDNKTPSGLIKTTSGGLAISISACDDDQLAAYTAVNNIINGAVTYLLVDKVKRFPGLTYGDYHNLICDHIQDSNNKTFLANSRVLKKVFSKIEKPVISSSLPFNIYEKVMAL